MDTCRLTVGICAQIKIRFGHSKNEKYRLNSYWKHRTMMSDKLRESIKSSAGEDRKIPEVPSTCKMPMAAKPPRMNGMAEHPIMSVDDARMLLC